jgi:hypothetical protein
MSYTRKEIMDAWYAASEPLDGAQYSVFSEKLKEICEFNGISPPEIRMFGMGSAAPNNPIHFSPMFEMGGVHGDSVNNRIYLSPIYAEHMVRQGSQEQLVCMVADDLAHVVLGHDKPVKKNGEYLVDRIGAAFIRDEELFKQALITDNAFMEPFRQMERDQVASAIGLTGVIARLGAHWKNAREEATYGTYEARLKNIQQDIDRQKGKGREL